MESGRVFDVSVRWSADKERHSATSDSVLTALMSSLSDEPAFRCKGRCGLVKGSKHFLRTKKGKREKYCTDCRMDNRAKKKRRWASR